MEPVAEFQSLSWHTIKGRGSVAACRWPEDGPAMRDVMGQVVRIDGALYRVRAIETFRPLYGAPFEEDKD